MRSLLFIALAALVCSSVAEAQAVSTASPLPMGAPTGTSTVFVPKGTPVVVKTTEAISSYAASPREPIELVVSQDIVVGGFVVAKAGDEADGQVLEAQQGRSGFDGIGYKAADLRIAVEAVHNFCGDTIKLAFIRSEYRRRQGMFGSNKDVEVVDGQQYAAATAYPQKICGVATTEADPAVPKDALPPDKN